MLKTPRTLLVTASLLSATATAMAASSHPSHRTHRADRHVTAATIRPDWQAQDRVGFSAAAVNAGPNDSYESVFERAKGDEH